MQRRTFLRLGIGGAALYGARELFAQDKSEKPTPEGRVLEAALAEMRRSGRGGLVFVVPEDAERRRRLGQALFEIVHQDVPRYSLFTAPRKDAPQPVTREAFVKEWRRDSADLHAAVVLVCPSRREATARFGAADNRILLDAKGQEVARARADDKALEPGPLHELVTLVKGADLGHLQRLARATELLLDPEPRSAVAAAVAAVRAKTTEPEALERAMAALRADLGRLRPWVLLAREEARDDKIRSRFQSLLDALPPAEQPELPYGAVMPRFASEGCDSYRELPDGAPAPAVVIACGMALPTAEGRRFLRFLK